MGIFNYLFSAGVAAKCMRNQERKESLQIYRSQQDAMSILREQKRQADWAAERRVREEILHYADSDFSNYVIGEQRNFAGEFQIAYQTYMSLADKQTMIRPLEEYPWRPKRLPGTGETSFGYEVEYKSADVIDYSIAEARRWAAKNGFAPDNVFDKIFCGWSPYHDILQSTRYCYVSNLREILIAVVHWNGGSQFWHGTYDDAIMHLKRQDEFLNYCLVDLKTCPYDRPDIVYFERDRALTDSWRLRLLGYCPSVKPIYAKSVMKGFVRFCNEHHIDPRFDGTIIPNPTDNQRRILRQEADKMAHMYVEVKK